MSAGLSRALGQACAVMSIIAICSGFCGMVLSFLFMTSASEKDIATGSAGFVAGAILIGTGLLSLTIQTAKPGDTSDLTG